MATHLHPHPLLYTAALLFAPTAASAHFVWVEPAATPNAAQVCFGEYPELREGAPLLEKVRAVRVYAGVGAAPVVIAHLDYGMLQRGATPPYFLRYEAQLLRGAGEPLNTEQITRWSAADTGMPLAARFLPGPDRRLILQVTVNGQPAAAEVAHGEPGKTELTKQQTDAAGRLALGNLSPGWHHLRILVDDGKPVTVDGKEGKSTRTYLSVMFNAAAAADFGSVAAAAGDQSPVQVLDEAHAARAHWGADFPGFVADAEFTHNGKQAKGTITVDQKFGITYHLDDPELEAALRPSFGSLIMHRQGGNPQYRASWRDAAAHPLGRAINLNDDLGSWYRVRDRQILQVNRTMGSQRFTNAVFENESTRLGFLPRTWSVAYYDNATNALLRVSTTRATWTWKGDVFLPATLDIVNAHSGGTDVSRLVLTNHRLLK